LRQTPSAIEFVVYNELYQLKTMVALRKLPPEVEEKILSCINKGSDADLLLLCALVCKPWLHYSRRRVFSEHPYEIDFEKWRHPDSTTVLFSPTSTIAPFIDSLRLREGFGTEESPYFLDQFFQRTPVGAFPSLKALKILGLEWSALGEEAQSMLESFISPLVQLDLVAMTFPYFTRFAAFLSAATSLQTLHVNNDLSQAFMMVEPPPLDISQLPAAPASLQKVEIKFKQSWVGNLNAWASRSTSFNAVKALDINDEDIVHLIPALMKLDRRLEHLHLAFDYMKRPWQTLSTTGTAGPEVMTPSAHHCPQF
jgi:hypothetical protein